PEAREESGRVATSASDAKEAAARLFSTRLTGPLPTSRPRFGSEFYREWISVAPKKYEISKAADCGESEPWTALASIEDAKSFRIVPGSAFAGSVAPMRSRRRAMAASPSSTMGMHGPWVMKAHRLP